MENVTTHLFNNSNNKTDGGQNSRSTTPPQHHAWEHGNLANNQYNFLDATSKTPASASPYFPKGGIYDLMFPHHHQFLSSSSSSPDPHLACLKLGKRHYFEDGNINRNNLVAINRQHEMIKKVKNLIDEKEQQFCGDGLGCCEVPIWGSPRCQVEGCSVILVNAKGYHKKHKVCEKHAKAPEVNVLGIQQRFCQQCSRFHAICEFDESKRSCRRRLAGHNERRRKSYQDQSAPSKLSLDKVLASGFSPLLNTGSALSLLSSNNNNYNSSPDLFEQSSAALQELIIKNRAAVLAKQVLDRNMHSWQNHPGKDQN